MTDDSDAFEFLERLDIDVDDVITKENFQEAIRGRFEIAGLGKPTQKQIDVLYPVADAAFVSFPNSGIRRIASSFFQGSNTRFSIAGQKGLFGISKALAFLKGGR